MDKTFIKNIFSGSHIQLSQILEIFRFQYLNNEVYRAWCDCLKIDIDKVDAVENIPFLPISFFKTHKVVCGNFEPELVFESSGTTQTVNSKHFIKNENLYKESFIKCFELFYGNIDEYCIVGLLPNYLERGNSSLVKMVDELIKLSNHADSGFYLYEFDKLHLLLQNLENKKQKTLLFGVTFALLDFAEQFPMQLKNTIVMDTGGMKGRKKEMTRDEVHGFLKQNLGVKAIHSEYGMTELLSQAYSKGDGKYVCPPWMKVLLRDENDPLLVRQKGKGLINIIDLANIYSCSFIATDDVGSIEENYFEIWGRLDNSDLRGCSLLAV
ncbi:acyl transferase [Arachidicoccus ginsenosidimutans]|nr:acyl transferase [Arachidicoccus sp. BS20]